MKNVYLLKVKNIEDFTLKVKYMIEQDFTFSEFTDNDMSLVTYIVISVFEKYCYTSTITKEMIEQIPMFNIIGTFDTIDELKVLFEGLNMGLLESMAGMHDDIGNTIKQNNKQAKKGKVFKTLREYLKHLDQ